MSKLTSECPVCHKKNIVETKSFNLGKSKFITLNCGHTYREILSVSSDNILSEIRLADGKVLYPYQSQGVKFAEQSGFSCLIADEMGLGKTIQAIGVLHLHLKELSPVLIVVKASLTMQWQRHIMSSLDKFAQIVDSRNAPIPMLPIYICSFDMVGKVDWSKLNPSIKTLIIDECQMIKNHDAKRTQAIRDLVKRTTKKQSSLISALERTKKIKRIESIAHDLMKYHGINDRFKLSVYNTSPKILGICKCKVEGEGIIKGEIVLSKQHIENSSDDEIIETILHEIAHAITPGAGHNLMWRDTAVSIGSNGNTYAFPTCEGSVPLDYSVEEPTIKHKIFLSGTPVKNNAIEYWPTLNLLRPQMFGNRDRFAKYEVGYYVNEKGVYKPGGLRYPEEFKKKTSDFIIRRLKKEVLPDLPAITRDYRYHEMTQDESKAYALGVKKLSDFLNSNPDRKSLGFNSALQGHIMVLRHITGLAKIAPILEYIDEFVEDHADDPSKKIALFHHHIDVGAILSKHLTERNIGHVQITSSMDVAKRSASLDEFRSSNTCRILIAPSLAMGEGYDLDYVDTGILLEREWNPANEEQVEGRFIRATPESIAKAARGELKATVVYPVAVDTIDEFFAELVERKRQYMKETLDGKADHRWDQSDIMLQLAQITVNKWKENR